MRIFSYFYGLCFHSMMNRQDIYWYFYWKSVLKCQYLSYSWKILLLLVNISVDKPTNGLNRLLMQPLLVQNRFFEQIDNGFFETIFFIIFCCQICSSSRIIMSTIFRHTIPAQRDVWISDQNHPDSPIIDGKFQQLIQALIAHCELVQVENHVRAFHE